MKDNVLIIGSGGREHTLAWKLAQSENVDNVYCAPGNGGTELNAINVAIKPDDFKSIADFVEEEDVNLTVVGPEAPLVDGIVDYFWDKGLPEKGHLIFGPSKDAAQLEGSKVFAKDFMKEFNIPTADYEIFDDADDATVYVMQKNSPVVVKASGLAAGKGAIVCKTVKEATDAIEQIMVEKLFGPSGDKVVIEEFMQGEEASILALTDGRIIRALASSQDHKQISDGDKGPNTGGMGAYAPAPIITHDMMEKVYQKILIPTIQGMNSRKMPFTGCLYAGLMIENGEPRVVEYNIRFGDPEAQPVLTMLDGDLYSILRSCCEGNLEKAEIKNRKGAACCVVMAAKGYPGEYEKGHIVVGLDDAAKMPSVKVFHAGTKIDGDKVISSGGRVLGVTGYSSTGIESAIKKAYAAVDCINIPTEIVNDNKVLVFRYDIGNKALRR